MTREELIEAMARAYQTAAMRQGFHVDGGLFQARFGDVLQAIEDAGFAVVPVEPTDVMLKEGHRQIDWCRNHQNTATFDHPSQNEYGETNCREDLIDAYKAMLEAAKP